jgi:hypothetical protein
VDVAGDNIQHLDRPWSLDKIMLLLDGEIEVDGEIHSSLSAYELRMQAMSTSSDFADLIVEAAQLDRAIQSGIMRDREVRLAMLLRTRGGFDEKEIEDLLGSKRPGYALLQRGAELIRRHERGQHSQLRRVRAQRGESDMPVCWRCLQPAVLNREGNPMRVGDWCGCVDKPRKSDRSHTGPGSTYDPLAQPDPAKMTADERAAEIEKLAATQVKGPIPGGENYRKKVSPVGATMFDPDDLRRADRAYHRGNRDGASASRTPTEQVPSV